MNNVFLKNSDNENIYPIRKHTPHTDAECIAAFISYMNAKAVEIGMTNTNFYDSIGLDANNKATASDMVQLSLCATGYDELCSVWNKDNYAMKIKGAHARTENLVSTVQDSTFENAYHIFGGKTGTLGVSNVILVSGTDNNKQLLCVIMNAIGDRFAAAKQACDIAENVLANPSYDYSGDTVNANYVQVSLVPTGNPRIYDGYDLPALYAKSATTQCVLASTTKIMTAICMLDWITDIHEWFTVKASDISTGSGQTMYAGDRITFKDALYAMMLPSSNTCAKAVARVVGERILNNAELAQSKL